jgi:hypothetical protein
MPITGSAKSFANMLTIKVQQARQMNETKVTR